MRSHQAPTPTNEVPPRQWPGTQYCHRDATWRVRGPPRSTYCVRPGTKRISQGKKHSPQWGTHPPGIIPIHCIRPGIYFLWMGMKCLLFKELIFWVCLFRGYQTYGRVHPVITVFPTRLDRVYEVVNPFLVELIFVGLTTLRQLGFSDVDYRSGNFLKQMFTSHHFVNDHVSHYR